MVMNTESARAQASGIEKVLGDIVARARTTGGVLVLLSAPVPPDAPEQPESVFGTTEEDLGLVSTAADAFEGVDELAPALHDLNIDRVIIGGVDVQSSVQQTAMAGLACNFDVVVLRDGTVDLAGGPVDWFPTAEAAGAMVKDVADVWLRM
ncbi:hypothetical protein GCM10022261_10940 [Brevibacterium daeguense]|uniref:Isochorismatase-like domain-containing protein n=2 Tax=Brevibacterium daeguense TaxID=909936 RepID=A0ABP8EHY5_9MICO